MDRADQIARELFQGIGKDLLLTMASQPGPAVIAENGQKMQARIASALRSYAAKEVNAKLEEVAEYSDEYARMLIGHANAAKDVDGVQAATEIAEHVRSLKSHPEKEPQA